MDKKTRDYYLHEAVLVLLWFPVTIVHTRITWYFSWRRVSATMSLFPASTWLETATRNTPLSPLCSWGKYFIDKNCLEVKSLDYPLTKSSQASSILIILLYCDTGVIPSTQITQLYLRMRIIVVPLVIHVLCCQCERDCRREAERVSSVTVLLLIFVLWGPLKSAVVVCLCGTLLVLWS